MRIVKTKVKSVDFNRCDVEITIKKYWSIYDEEETETLEFRAWAPISGGYVHDNIKHGGTLGPQLCEGMNSTGSTLYWSGKVPLAVMIRKEVKKLRRDLLK